MDLNSPLTGKQALKLAEMSDLHRITAVAADLRDEGFGEVLTYSKKVFIPLTQLCRDVCHYCTFATTPKKLDSIYLSIDEVLATAKQGATMGCKEALFTLGEKPELRYRVAKEWLASGGWSTTIEYLEHAAKVVLEETGLLPHLNPGNLEPEELSRLRTVAPSMGIMLESASDRLTEKGMPHYGSPDKIPQLRLNTLKQLGEARVPTTTGILIGIGETRLERIESLLAIREIYEKYGHIQEVIIQNFRAKPNTKMHSAPEPELDELLWTIAVARILLGSSMSIQAPPNLSPGVLESIIHAGINDWGGVSPLTPDFVNPEAPWPSLTKLEESTADAGKFLHERLTVYPNFIHSSAEWIEPGLHSRILKLVDSEGYPRTDDWVPGIPADSAQTLVATERTIPTIRPNSTVATILEKATAQQPLSELEIERLFKTRGKELKAVIQCADAIRHEVNGDEVSYVVNRNINYTNICYFKCQFCAFSKGKLSENLRGRPYDLSQEEIQRRVVEAWERGATEVCMQGGIHPEYTGAKYLDILQMVKEVVPRMHVHAFSPLEVWQGAKTLGCSLKDFLIQLKDAGLGTLPGTAAEILDDEVRKIICPDKINTQQWIEVVETAHEVGLNTTSTIMFGHVDQPINWARHLICIRNLQIRSAGITEFVPLPFIHMQAPMYLKGKARKGPTFREVLLMHAVARIALHPHITNIQVSWVKLGLEGVRAALNAGCNDMGGTLMNESISRAAGNQHGQEFPSMEMDQLIRSMNRVPIQRTTLYEPVKADVLKRGRNPSPLQEIKMTPARKYERKRKHELVRNEISPVE